MSDPTNQISYLAAALKAPPHPRYRNPASGPGPRLRLDP